MRLARLSKIREYLRRRVQRRYGYRRRDWEEIAGVIRFNLMCAHTIDRPISQSEADRYVMVGYESFLPIQCDSRFGTFRNGEANVKEHVWSEIGTGKTGGIRRTCRNNDWVKSDRPHDWNRHQDRRSIDLGDWRLLARRVPASQ